MMQLEVLFKDYGVNLREVARAAGYSHSALLRAMEQKGDASKWRALATVCREKAKLLKNLDLTADDPRVVIRAAAVKQRWLADKIGVSKQALDQAIDRGLSRARAKEIEKVLAHVAAQYQQTAASLTALDK